MEDGVEDCEAVHQEDQTAPVDVEEVVDEDSPEAVSCGRIEVAPYLPEDGQHCLTDEADKYEEVDVISGLGSF